MNTDKQKFIYVERVNGATNPYKAASDLASKRLSNCGFHVDRTFASFDLLAHDVKSFGYILKLKDKFKCKDGTPTAYAFSCGHILKHRQSFNALTYGVVECYQEAGCKTWQIRSFRHYNGSSSCDRLFWHTVESITEAKKLFKQEKNKMQKGAYNAS